MKNKIEELGLKELKDLKIKLYEKMVQVNDQIIAKLQKRMRSEKIFAAIPREQAEIVNDIIDHWDAYCFCADDSIRFSSKRCPVCRLVGLGKIKELKELKSSKSRADTNFGGCICDCHKDGETCEQCLKDGPCLEVQE